MAVTAAAPQARQGCSNAMTDKRRAPGYRNTFSMDRLGKMPLILKDGTSVEFPSNWSRDEAEEWRKRAGLSKPAK
jgi:hypothetical protein